MFNASCSKSESAVINNIPFIFHLDTLDTCQVNKGAERESRVCRNMIKGIRNVSRFSLNFPQLLDLKILGVHQHGIPCHLKQQKKHTTLSSFYLPMFGSRVYILLVIIIIIFQIIFPLKSLLVDHCL